MNIKTTALTVLIDLTTAVAIGTLLSGLILLFDLGNSYLREYKVDTDGEKLPHKIKSFTVEGALFFGVSDAIVNSFEVMGKDADIVVVNLMNAPMIDATGIVVLGKLKERMEKLGKKLILTGLKKRTYEKLLKLNILDGQEKEINMGRIAEAIAYAKELARSNELKGKN